MGTPSMIQNIEAIVAAIGTDKIGLTMDLALTEWDSADQRDEFLATLTSPRGN